MPLSLIEESRLSISKETEQAKKSQLGQFFTPAKTARFMANMFIQSDVRNCRLLDAGAGIGSLSAAFLERCSAGVFDFKSINLDAFEIDELLHPYITRTIEHYSQQLSVNSTIYGTDFVSAAVDSIRGSLFTDALPRYTHAILNPPYKKIRSDSHHRTALSQVGIETVNLYSAFVALALSLLEDGGQLVAIIPRSFCNGPYYRPFRKFILTRSAILHIHLFDSRNKAFQDDNVLQENVILLLQRSTKQENVIITTSTDDTFADLAKHTHAFTRIVFPNDNERIIHIPFATGCQHIKTPPAIRYSLDDIGINVSTGPVVEFRMKPYLRDMPEAGTVPLLFPSHFKNHQTLWPQKELKKPNAIYKNVITEKLLFPNGNYCVVRRFSSKEEKRRITASVVLSDTFPDTELLGFENHLNVFHTQKKGLPEALAFGLSLFLNTAAVDTYFRSFSGHTQVNVSDLKLLRYPSRTVLISLGKWAMRCQEIDQVKIDEQLASLIS